MSNADKDILYRVAYDEAVRALAEQQAEIDMIHRDLSIHMNKSYTANRVGVQQFAVLLQIASGLLTVEVILWIIAIATSA